MTPYFTPAPPSAARQASAAVASSRQPTPAENSVASDPFALHLDAAAEKVAIKRSDKQASKDAKDASQTKEAPPQQKPRKDGAKKSSDARKKDDSAGTEASAEVEPVDSAEEEVDATEVVAETETAGELSVEDACHQQDSLFVQALLNQTPKKAEELQPQIQELPEEQAAAALKLPELPKNSQSAPQAKSESLQNSQQSKTDTQTLPAAHDAPKPEQAIKPEEVVASTPAPVPDEKSAPRATPPHMDGKESHKDSGSRKEAGVATTQTLASAVSDASALSQDAKPEVLPEIEPEHAPAPMPIAAQQGSNQPAPNAQSAESARAAQDSPRTAPENTFDQIVLGLRTKLDAANQKANIELNPPNLGKLHVSVELSNGILTAQFRTSTDVVRDLLSSHMDQLRSVLEGQGIAVDKLAVSAGGATSEQNPQANTSTHQNSAGHDGRSGGAFANDRHGPRQSSSDAFSKMWRAALDKEEPIDLLA